MSEQQHNRRHLLKWAGLLGALGALRVPLPAFAQGRHSEGIVGSWMVSINYAAGTGHTRGLATFTSDGGFIGSVSAYETRPANPTPSRGTTIHGSWEFGRHRTYKLTAFRLHMDQQGTLLGTMKTQISITLDDDADSWDGNFTFEAINLAGDVTRSDHGTLHATRISVES